MPSKKPKKQTPSNESQPERRSVDQVLNEISEILYTVERGLRDLKNSAGPDRLSGLHNVAVFGRSVRFGLNRLTNLVDGYQEWVNTKFPPSVEPLLRVLRRSAK
jgi:hypothetical protein